MRRPLRDECFTPCGLEERDRVAQFVRSPGAGGVDRGRKGVRLETRDSRQSGGPFISREARVPRYPPCGGLVERAYRRRVKRIAASVAQNELARTADLFGQRAACSLRRRRERSESNGTAPQHQRSEREQQDDNRRTVPPEQREQGRVI